MSQKSFDNVINDLKGKNITLEVKLCPDCETEVSIFGENYFCDECGCLKRSCLVRKITVNREKKE